jgi:pullulanase
MEGETAKSIFLVFNANSAEQTVTLPEGSWNVYINGEKAGTEILETVSGTVAVAPISALVLVQEDAKAPAAEDTANIPWGIIVGAAASAVAAGAVITGAILSGRKKKEQ